MTVDQMRTVLAERYKGPRWILKCQTMPDRQIVAIYKDLERKGKLNKKYNKSKRKEPGVVDAVQITMAELYPGLFAR